MEKFSQTRKDRKVGDTIQIPAEVCHGSPQQLAPPSGGTFGVKMVDGPAAVPTPVTPAATHAMTLLAESAGKPKQLRQRPAGVAAAKPTPTERKIPIMPTVTPKPDPQGDLAAQRGCREFIGKFGRLLGPTYFAEGLSLTQAQERFEKSPEYRAAFEKAELGGAGSLAGFTAETSLRGDMVEDPEDVAEADRQAELAARRSANMGDGLEALASQNRRLMDS